VSANTCKDLMILERYKFPDIFIRRTKKPTLAY
jgi:hypothetical protein